jgi:toxin ParE1/3/4
VKSLVYSPRAERDLAEIWTYTPERWSVLQADTYLTQLLDALDSVAAGRLKGMAAAGVRLGYCRLLVGSHVAFFKETGAEVTVVRILHQSMDADQHLYD